MQREKSISINSIGLCENNNKVITSAELQIAGHLYELMSGTWKYTAKAHYAYSNIEKPKWMHVTLRNGKLRTSSEWANFVNPDSVIQMLEKAEKDPKPKLRFDFKRLTDTYEVGVKNSRVIDLKDPNAKLGFGCKVKVKVVLDNLVIFPKLQTYIVACDDMAYQQFHTWNDKLHQIPMHEDLERLFNNEMGRLANA